MTTHTRNQMSNLASSYVTGRTARRFIRTAAAAFILLTTTGLAACSSSHNASQNNPPSPSLTASQCSNCSTSAAAPTDITTPTDSDVTAAGPQSPSAAPFSMSSTGTFHLTSSTGIAVDATIKLQPPVAATQATTAWTGEGASGDIPCVTDPQTDAVMVGSLAFANTTPSYTPDFYLNFNSIAAGGTLALGAGYGNQCITDGPDAYEGSAIQPTWQRSSWGPVPIVIVIHHDIGPDYPNGNPHNLSTVELVVNSQSGDQYGVTKADGTISQLNGPVLQLHLEQITG